MDLGLTKIEWDIVTPTNGPGQVKYTNFCLECKPQAGAQIGVIDVCILTIVSSPTSVY